MVENYNAMRKGKLCMVDKHTNNMVRGWNHQLGLYIIDGDACSVSAGLSIVLVMVFIVAAARGT